MIAFALMLTFSAIAAWIVAVGAPPAARAYVRFACVLYAALAVATVADEALADAVVLIVSALAPAMLALAAAGVFRSPLGPAFAGAALAAACLGGIAAAATGIEALAFVPFLVSVLGLAGTSLRRLNDARAAALQTIASAVSFLAAACAYVAAGTSAHAALMVFSSAGLLGVALALTRVSDAGVDERSGRDLRGAAAIRRLR